MDTCVRQLDNIGNIFNKDRLACHVVTIITRQSEMTDPHLL